MAAGPLVTPLNLERSPWTDLQMALPPDCVFKCDSTASLADAVTNARRTVDSAVAHLSAAFAHSPKLIEFARVASLPTDAYAKMQIFERNRKGWLHCKIGWNGVEASFTLYSFLDCLTCGNM